MSCLVLIVLIVVLVIIVVVIIVTVVVVRTLIAIKFMLLLFGGLVAEVDDLPGPAGPPGQAFGGCCLCIRSSLLFCCLLAFLRAYCLFI